VAGLQRKLAAVPGAGADVALAVCARERVRQVPDGVRAITAVEIFGRREE
jgi:hypothetical protein